jgi:peptidoglycan/LPS O-acetylase OafA/YrhL
MASPNAAHADTRPSGVTDGRRPDIQGLRTVAVVIVILDHLLGWPSGGFVGVDVFFVISGYLITGLLLREHERTGTISFSGFYRRRIKRILPAATLVLGVTVAASFVVFTRGRAVDTAWDSVWAFFFSSNWHTAAIGTDYFQAAGATSPLQHYWSLSVEEQFYFVWPWVMLLIFVIGGRRAAWDRHRSRRVIGIVMVGIVVASFVWALWETNHAPTWAYFSTFSRVWELGIGALLAAFATTAARLPPRLRPPLAWLGLGGIAASAFLVSSDSGFPAPWAVLPVLSTALVIVAGERTQRWLWPLTNPLSVYVGNISFSLYLWHFPVIVVGGAVLGQGALGYAAAAVVTVSLSLLSYHLVEDPIRQSAWLEKRPRAPRQRELDTPQRRAGRRSRALILAGSAVLAVVVVTASIIVPRSAGTAAAPAPAANADSATGVVLGPVERALVQEVSVGLMATSWPTLNPSVDELGTASLVPEWVQDECLNVSESNVKDCVYGNPAGTKLAVLLGDSHAISYLPAIRLALPAEWRIQVLTKAECPVADLTVLHSVANGTPPTAYPGCDDHRAWTVDWLTTQTPDLVIMTDSVTTLTRISGISDDPLRLVALREATERSVSTIAPLAGQVVDFLSPPPGMSIKTCYTTFSSPADCVNVTQKRYDKTVRAQTAGVAAVAADNVTVVSTSDFFCLDGRCPSFVGDMPLFADGNHLTLRSSERLAGFFTQVLANTITKLD